MKEYFFSIIVPAYNRASFLEKSLQSVLNQTYPHYELIIVDDGSKDNSGQIVKNLIAQHPEKNIQYYYKENGERGAARNHGAEKASGEILTFFDSDDLLYPNHLSEANLLLNTQPDALWFHLGYDIKNENLEFLSKGTVFIQQPNRLLISGNHLSCNGVFIRKDLFLSTRFNENRALAGLEDWELWLRLSAEHPLFFGNKISSTVLQHKDRSVLDKDPGKLIRRVSLLMDLVENNASVRKFLGKDFVLFKSSCTSYISLHLALMKGQKTTSIRYLLKTLGIHPGFLFKHRCYAILKHLI